MKKTKNSTDIMDIDIELFQNRLKDLYKEKGYSQADLARLSGISENTISKWFRTDYTEVQLPSLEKIYRVCQALGCSVDYLINPNTDCKTITNQKISDYTGLSDKAINALVKDKKDRLYILDCINLLLGHIGIKECKKVFQNIFLYLLKNKRVFKSLDGNTYTDYLILNTEYTDNKHPAIKGHGIGINANNLDGVFLQNITSDLAVLRSKL